MKKGFLSRNSNSLPPNFQSRIEIQLSFEVPFRYKFHPTHPTYSSYFIQNNLNLTALKTEMHETLGLIPYVHTTPHDVTPKPPSTASDNA